MGSAADDHAVDPALVTDGGPDNRCRVEVIFREASRNQIRAISTQKAGMGCPDTAGRYGATATSRRWSRSPDRSAPVSTLGRSDRKGSTGYGVVVLLP